MTSRIRTLIQIGVLSVMMYVSACNGKPTKPHAYVPYPQQLYEVSADSHYVYFRDDGSAFDRPAGIYRIRIDGDTTVEPVIIHPSVYFPSISPSGRQLAFADLANALIIRNLETGKDSVVLRADVVDINWYNEDTLICEFYPCEIELVDIRSGQTRQIWGENGCHPSVSREGIIVFVQHLPNVTLDSSVLRFASLQGDTLDESVTFRDDFVYRPDWDNSGRNIAFVRDYLYHPRLALVSWPEMRVIDSLVLHVADPFFTQNDQIIYIHLGDKSNEESDQIWIMDSDGSHKELLMQ